MKQSALETTLLYDYYGGMLTEKQRTCFDLYYNQDLSLGEIAEEAGISRQGVYDTIARAEAALREMEAQLGCVGRSKLLRQACAALLSLSDELRQEGRQELAARVETAVNLIKE
ncbi:MAG: sigma factor-like helix-turn-helix DNA-binding protein [Oscillospiraceae bacterium]|nr:sigma factor-like helix-turn-helix DNA-binding protein [Oscillospiraceae bacterium]